MDDLTLVGVHDDGEHLLLTGPDGRRYRLRVDDALRAAVRRDRARLGQLQIEMDGLVRPREIQARIRAGETAEQVAEAAGVPIERIRRYEGPVLAERSFIATQAREVRIRRAGSDGGSAAHSSAAKSLGTVVAERLAQREVDAEQVSWDAWRADDNNTWVVQLEFTAGSRSRQARWAYDVSVRHVAAMDDEARWLTEDEPPTAPMHQQRRLTPVRDRGYDVESSPAARSAPEEPPAIDLLDTLRERRGRRNRPGDEDGGSADPVRQAIDSMLSKAESLGDPPAAHPVRSRAHEARDGEVLVLPDADPLPGRELGVSVGVGAKAATASSRTLGARGLDEAPSTRRDGSARADEDEGVGAGVGARPVSRKQRRASVPSWDDIVFGQRRD